MLALEVSSASFLLDAFHDDLDVGLHSNASEIDVQFSGDRLCAGSSSLCSGLEHCDVRSV